MLDRHRYLCETGNEGKSSLKILITFSSTSWRNNTQENSSQSLEEFQCHNFQFICFMFSMILDIVLVCQTLPSDAAERGLFQVSFSVGEMDRKTRKHSSFPGRVLGHRCLFFRIKVAWAGS